MDYALRRADHWGDYSRPGRRPARRAAAWSYGEKAAWRSACRRTPWPDLSQENETHPSRLLQTKFLFYLFRERRRGRLVEDHFSCVIADAGLDDEPRLRFI